MVKILPFFFFSSHGTTVFFTLSKALKVEQVFVTREASAAAKDHLHSAQKTKVQSCVHGKTPGCK